MPDKKLIDSELYEQIEYWQRGYNDLLQQIKEAHANIERLNKTNENLLRQLCRKVNRESKVIEKLIKTEAYRMEKRFADAVKGLHVYGAKVTDGNQIAAMFCSVA